MTQREVAKRLGIPQSIVSELENGQRRLDVAELKSLARLYSRPVGWFVAMEEAPVDGLVSVERASFSPLDAVDPDDPPA